MKSPIEWPRRQQLANSMATANLGVSVTAKHGLPQEAGSRSQNERNESVDYGKDKEAPILHSTEKNRVPQGTMKVIESRHYQLLTGHALIAPFLKEKLKKTDSDQCWWCEAGKRQTRDHLFKECGRWKTEINVLWKTRVEAPQEQDIRVVQGEGNGGDFAVPEGHGYQKNQEWSIKTTHTRL